MDVSRIRRGTNGGVAAGSVWESRMKLDKFKVFNSEENSDENNNNNDNIIEEINNTGNISENDSKKMNLRPKQSVKRKTWKTESSNGSPVQIARKRSDFSKNFDEKGIKDLMSVSADEGIKKTRSDASKELSVVSVNGVEKFSPVQTTKLRSLSSLSRGIKSEANKGLNGDGNEKKAKIGSKKAVDEDGDLNSNNGVVKMQVEMADEESIEKTPVGIQENCKEFDLCEDKAITSKLGNVGQAKSASKSDLVDDDDDDKVEVEVEIEKKSLVVVKEISSAKQRPKKVLIEDKKHNQQHSSERPVGVSSFVKKQPPLAVNNVRIHPTPTKTKTSPVLEEVNNRIPRQHRKLQRLVDIVMWRDVSRSAFIFGVGTFVTISSSYTQDLNISIISVLSYLGLVYLAAIFLFRSLICRGGRNVGSRRQEHVIGEEEAIWLIKLILPYVNEFFLSLRALFSGDPATTMKMAVLLFILARCGSSITIWKMAKFETYFLFVSGFFGVFIVPKVCTSYSTQIKAFGTFWIRRFQDAWDSCSHKKAVAFGVFTLVWNLSSIVARIWAVFMLFVAFKYYQQSLMGGEEARVEDSSLEGQIEGQRKDPRSTIMEKRIQKKAF